MTTEAIITLPDGRKARITGPNREGLIAKAEQLKSQTLTKPPPKPAGVMEAVTRGAGRTFIDNMLEIPKQVFQPEFGAIRPTQTLPHAALTAASRLLPTEHAPTGEDIVATAAAALPGGGDIQSQLQRGQQIQQDRPGANATGEVIGDVATLLTGRLPAANAINRAEQAFVAGKFKNLDNSSEFSRAWNKFVKSDFVKDVVKRPGFRAAETGMEGAVLSLMKDGDPLATGLYTAGAQLAGSGSIGFMNHFLEGKGSFGVRLGLGIFAASAILGTAQNLTGTGEGNIFDTLEANEMAYDKAALALALGVMGHASGLSRVRSGDVPKLGDAITSIPRGVVVSLIEDITHEREAGGDDVQNTMAHIMNNPDVFNKTQKTQLNAGMEKGTFGETVERLMQTDPRFAKIILKEPERMLRPAPQGGI